MNQGLGLLSKLPVVSGSLILFWLGAVLIQQGELTIGLLIAFTQYVGNFWEPINRLGQMYNQLLVAMASSERIFEFIDEKPSIDDQPGAKKLPTIKGDIKLENVVFEYEKDVRLSKGSI